MTDQLTPETLRTLGENLVVRGTEDKVTEEAEAIGRHAAAWEADLRRQDDIDVHEHLLAENRRLRKRLEEAERKENILLGMVAEEIGFDRARKLWERTAALALEEKP